VKTCGSEQGRQGCVFIRQKRQNGRSKVGILLDDVESGI
jgi:hypothetical protein